MRFRVQQRRAATRTAAVGTVAAVTLGAIVTSGAASSRAADAPANETLQFTAVSVQSIRLNVGAPAATTGDRLVFSHTLTKAGKTEGLSGVECILTSVTSSKAKDKQKAATSTRSHCVATIVLTDGQIAAQGLTALTEPGGNFELAVTGGTGRFTGAAGTLRKGGGKDKGTYTLTLVPRR